MLTIWLTQFYLLQDTAWNWVSSQIFATSLNIRKRMTSKAETHDLERLFRAFKLHISETIKNLKDKYGIDIDKADIDEFNHYCKEVDRLTNIFNLLDKNSDSFRYPIDRENNKSFEQKENN
jgi:hypothetical protein